MGRFSVKRSLTNGYFLSSISCLAPSVYNDEFTYSENQFKKINETNESLNIYGVKEYSNLSDPDAEFFYDAYGNIIADFYCEVVMIPFNLLNLSDMVQFRNGIRIINHPSGLPWEECEGANMQPYKYNGKEFIEMHGYDTYDYGARRYYLAIQRFTSIDPLADKYYFISPYAFCSNNPINRIDPDGMDDYKINSYGRIWL